jgi:hypothetical protein
MNLMVLERMACFCPKQVGELTLVGIIHLEFPDLSDSERIVSKCSIALLAFEQCLIKEHFKYNG